MRRSLNENPVVQIAVLGLGAAVVAVLLLSRLGGGGADPAASDPPPAPVTGAPATPAPAVPAEPEAAGAAESQAPAAATGSVEPAAPATARTLVPGKGLPTRVVLAYARDRAVVLLIVKGRGIDDRLVRRSVERLRARPGVAVFVVPARNVARYSRITRGVNVNRTPALVVILPRSLTDSVPTATVSYGFRSAGGVEQALDDALYRGPTVPQHPG